MDRRGIEPRFPACKASVVPLDQRPDRQRSVRELNPVFLLTEEACCRNTYRPVVIVIPDRGYSPRCPNRTIVLLVVTQASSPLDHGIELSFK